MAVMDLNSKASCYIRGDQVMQSASVIKLVYYGGPYERILVSGKSLDIRRYPQGSPMRENPKPAKRYDHGGVTMKLPMNRCAA